MEIENLPEEESSNADDVDVPSAYRDLRALQFDNIDFRYDRDVILDHTSLTINKGILWPLPASPASARARC